MAVQPEVRNKGILNTVIGLADDTFTRITAGISAGELRRMLRGEAPGRPNPRLKPHSETFLLHIKPTYYHESVTRFTHTFRLGLLSTYLFIIETITGIFLMIWYAPSPERAYVDMIRLLSNVPFGQFMRDLHRLGAELMVIAVTIHMVRAYLTGSYKAPRQFTWFTGVILLVVTLFLSFSGYLLPWDQLAVWAITVGSNMARATPVLGHEGPGAQLLTLGGVTFFLFLVETVTGVLLMFYYRPTLEWAYNDILALRDVYSLGIMREIHRWGAHAMVITVWLHMYRVFLTGSYKPPREFNWVIGVILLLLTLLLSFTGYLLPWDQLAVWAITVGSNMARATPVLGHEGPGHQLLTLGYPMITSGTDARFALLGARNVGEETLNRFYILHCIAIPLAVALLLAIHFWRVRKDGGISGPL